MSQTKFVDYRDHGFWAYDVALNIFLKHLIDAAETRLAAANEAWLAEAVSWWRVVAGVGDYGLEIDGAWSESQLDAFVGLADQACQVLALRDRIPADEIAAWPILDDLHIFPRGATEVRTGPVIELGRAIIAIVRGTLPTAPAGTLWLYGTPEGRETIRMRQ